MWHGSPNGAVGGGKPSYGVHVGTHEAAKQALEARIGKPHEGSWDGTREYGKTMLNRDQEHHQFNPADRTWTNTVDKHPPTLPSSPMKYSDSSVAPMSARPNIQPVRIVGRMTNTPQNPHEDFKANGMMAGQLKRGRAKSGYFYRNVGEDEGSVSAVVPRRAHVETHPQHLARLAHGHISG